MSSHPDPAPRVLVIDDNPAIHEDFRKILQPSVVRTEDLDAFENELLGKGPAPAAPRHFRVDSAHQGQDGLAMAVKALEENDPYALAFVDVRMPPGWDGIETLEQLWKVCPDLQAVICTAYSDYSWKDMRRRFGERDNLLVLRKPFETMEVLQIAHTLTRKWELLHATRRHLQSLDRTVQERTHDLQSANENLRQVHDECDQVEEALKQSEDRFVRAFQSSPIPMVIKDARKRRFLDCNPAFLQLTGYTAEELQQEAVFSEPTFSEHPILTGADGAGEGRLTNQPITLTRRDNATRETLVSREPMMVADVSCMLFIIQDITEQLVLQDRLRQAQKMEAIGLLASGIAHEFNNILTVIQCNAKLLQCSIGASSPESSRIDPILNASQRAASLTSQLLAFSRKRALKRRRLDLPTVLDDTQAMLTGLLGEHYNFLLACPKNLPAVMADEDSITQVVMNLVLNARDSMPDGGSLRLEAAQVLLGEEEARAHPDGRPGEFVVLKVEDDGCGMDTQVLTRLFEPFFTTKEVGKGTGLGLCTIHGIVQQHEGWIRVSSKPGRGTTFSVYLPACTTSDSSEPLPGSAETGSVPKGAGQHLLVVEDETVLREIICEVLRAHGYRVSEACNGDEALLAHQASAIPVELLVTDLVMPGGTTGVELAKQLTTTDPQLRILITSGYSSEILGSDSPVERGVPFLAKPYEPSNLLTMVHQCLHDGRARDPDLFSSTEQGHANEESEPATRCG